MSKLKLFQTWSITLTIILMGCGGNKNDIVKETKKYVKTFTVEQNSLNDKLVFNGTIKEKSAVNMAFRVGGQISSVNVSIGDYVEQGQIIASIDKRDYQIQLQTRKAQYEQSFSEYKRYKELFEQGKLPANNFEKIESGYLITKAAYENAVNQLKDTDLKAPFSGYIDEVLKENFEPTSPGQPIASLVDISSLEVVVFVSEGQINNIQKNSKSFLTVKKAHVENLPVYVKSIDKKKQQNGLYEVRFGFRNSKELQILPGMTAGVMLNAPNKTGSINIPSSAIFNDGDSNCVWIYNEESQTVSKKTIQINQLTSNGYVEIRTGVAIGDTIIAAGVNSLTEGQKVSPLFKTSDTNKEGLL